MEIFFQILLVIGLMSACMGIDLQAASSQWKKIILVITVGVLLKAIITAVAMYVIGVGDLSPALALIVTQIDPISVGYLGGSGTLSPAGLNLLSFWANFDDPMTVLLFQYGALPIADVPSDSILLVYAANAVLGCIGYLLRYSSKNTQLLFLFLVSIGGVFFGMTLAVSICALFLRPLSDDLVAKITKYVYWIVVVLFVLLCIQHYQSFSLLTLKIGVVLGIMAHVSHAIVSFLLVRGQDVIPISKSQQNGLTSMILTMSGTAVLGNLYPQYPLIPIVCVSLITINSIYFGLRKI
jgi:NhaP-type Na+/H+ or K+/H+ antiporter